MKPKVSIASLLLVITAITVVRNTRDYGNIYNQIRAPPVKKRCDAYDDISKWIDAHVNLSAQLSKFQSDQAAILSYLKKTPYSKTCRFYEEITLNRIVEKANRINKESGAEVEKLNSSGHLGNDLENVLHQIKKFVPKGIRRCCENLTKLIENHKEDLQTKIRDLPNKLSETESGKLNENDSIQNNLGHLEKQFEEIKPLFQKLKQSFGDEEPNTECCNGLKESIQALENKLRLIKGEGDKQSQQIENQLKELKDKIREKVEMTNVFWKTLSQRSENIKNMLSNCNKNCVNKNVSTDTNNFLDLEKNSETLQKLVETFFTKLGGLDTINLNVTLNICQENNETLSKIQSKIEFLLKHNSKTCFEGSSGGSESTSLLIIKNCSSNENLHNSIAELQNQTENLRNELKKFPKCCQKIDSLSLNVGKLEKQMKEMNQTYNDHINANAKQLNSIKENMGESLRKLGDNHTADNESLSKLARKLKKDLKKGSLTLGFLKERQDGLLKDRNTTQISLYSPDEMNGLKKDLDEFRQVIDGKLKDLELKKQSKIDDRQRLERFNTETNQDLDKLNKISLVHKELEMRIKEQIEGLIKKANEMLECKKNCSKIDTMNDLMDQVEDMEKILKKSKT